MDKSGRDYDYRIKKLSVYPEKGAKPVLREEIICLEGKGIQGDFHADGGERQLSLLTEDKKKWMEAQEIKGFCFRKYKENILLETVGKPEKNICPGDKLEIGDAVLEVTESFKICHPELCDLAEAGSFCLLAGGHSFAKVVKSGTVRTGMPVFVKQKAAARGICEL